MKTYIEQFLGRDTTLPLCKGLIDVRKNWNKQLGINYVLPAV